MIASMLTVAVIAMLVAGLLRAGAASLLRTPRADALHDAAEGTTGAGKIAAILDDRDAIVPGINIVHAGLLLVAAITGTWAVTVSTEGPRLLVSLLLLGIVLILFGDLIPRSVGRTRPYGLAYRLAVPLDVAVTIGSRVADIVRDDPAPSRAERIDEEEDDEEEIALIESVLQFTQTLVREVMVPRPDMVTVKSTASIDELLDLISGSGYSRVPVVGDGVDDVLGLVIAKDLLPRMAVGDREARLVDVMRRIDFVPENKKAADLLREMQASKSHLAIVVDEFGVTAGLVSIEDLLEELVGEIVDEYDAEEMLVEEIATGAWRVDGRMVVSDLVSVIGQNLPEGDWDTVGGLVLDLAGRVPVEGERFAIDGSVIEVLRVQGRRVAEVEIHADEAANV